MNSWVLFQVVLSVLCLLGVGLLWVRQTRPPKEDPKLSRGLQLLQSKIAVLEDLSDRSDHQVKHHKAILDQKFKEVHTEINRVDRYLEKLNQSILKSEKVAKIFQDKIPHEEIIERQKTYKYIQAAKRIHNGDKLEVVSKELDIPAGELSFLARINKDELRFSDSDLPDWVVTDEEREELKSKESSDPEENHNTDDRNIHREQVANSSIAAVNSSSAIKDLEFKSFEE